MTAIFVILLVSSGRDHRDLDGCRQDRGRSGCTPWGRNNVEDGRAQAFCFAMQSALARGGKSRCPAVAAKRTRPWPVFDQTCPIEDVVAAPVLETTGLRERRQ
jgi:hypothetical protein